MSVRSGQSVTKGFTTRRFDTGAATNADSTPTGTLYVNGTANGATVTVTNITTGRYKAAVTLPTLSVGDLVELHVSATVNSVTDGAFVWYDSADVAFFGATPRSVPDLQFWFEPRLGGLYQDSAGSATPATANNDPVGYLPDLSGNGYHATQSGAAGLKPLLQTSGVNSLSSVLADGSNDYLTLGNPAALTGATAGAFTITYVVRLTSLPTIATVISRGQIDADLWDFLGTYSASGASPTGGVFHGIRASASPLSSQLTTATNYVVTHRVTPTAIDNASTGLRSYLHEFFVDGVLVGRTPTNAFSAGSSWDLFRRNDGNFYFPGHLAGMAFYSRSLSDAERESVEGYFGATFGVPCGRGLVNVGEPLVNLIIDGNSIPNGSGASATYYGRAFGKLGYPHRVHMLAKDGNTTSERTSAVATQLASCLDPTMLNVVVIDEITNDITAGTSAATCYSNAVAYCNAVKALLPTGKIRIILTTPRSRNWGGSQSTNEATRQSVMTSLRTDPSPVWDYLLDFGNSSTITVYGTSVDVSGLGAPTAYSSTTYFQNDGVHTNYTGKGVEASAFAAAFNGLVEQYLSRPMADNQITAAKLAAGCITSSEAPALANLDAAVSAVPTAAQNAAALLDLSNGVETGITPRQALRLILAASAGKLSGAATTTITIRNVGDTKTRITATVDSDGNRSAVTVDAT